MIVAKLLSLLGLAAVRAPDDHLVAAKMRHASAASWQHGLITSRAQTAALDRIDANETDPRRDELKSSAEQMRDTIAELLDRGR